MVNRVSLNASTKVPVVEARNAEKGVKGTESEKKDPSGSCGETVLLDVQEAMNSNRHHAPAGTGRKQKKPFTEEEKREKEYAVRLVSLRTRLGFLSEKGGEGCSLADKEDV